MRTLISFSLLLVTITLLPLQCPAKLVIADGGASGYLMENNLPATTLAVTMDADIIKLDLVLTGDNEVIVFSSPYLEYSSNVAEIFPDRIREDGHFYALDFKMSEIRKLSLRDPDGRFSAELEPRFTIATLQEQLALIQSLEKSLNKTVTVAVELKKTWLHRKEGRDLTAPALSILQQHGYAGQMNNTFLLSYDVDELQRIAKQILPEKQMSFKLVQLIDKPGGNENMVEEWGEYHSYNYDWIFSNTGLHALARSVTAIGLPKHMLVDAQKNLKLESFVTNAQKLDTMIFTFPVDKNKRARVPFARSFEEELEFFYYTAGVDGIFTDFCEDAGNYRQSRIENPQVQPSKETVLPATDLNVDDPLQITSPTAFEMEN